MALTEAQLRAEYAAMYPRRDWNGDCQAVVVNAAAFTGGLRTTYLTATLAYRASEIVSTDPALAEPGASHFWSIPDPDGHVALELTGGGRILQGAPSTLIDDFWGTSLGVTTVSALHARRPGWTYLGWSRTNGVNRVYLSTPIPVPEEVPLMEYEYIYTAGKWALVHPLLLDGGVLVTTQQSVAIGWEGALGVAKRAREVPAARWDATIASARDLAAQAQKAYPAGTAHADPEVRRLLEELIAATAAPRTTTVG